MKKKLWERTRWRIEGSILEFERNSAYFAQFFSFWKWERYEFLVKFLMLRRRKVCLLKRNCRRFFGAKINRIPFTVINFHPIFKSNLKRTFNCQQRIGMTYTMVLSFTLIHLVHKEQTISPKTTMLVLVQKQKHKNPP